MSKSRSPHRKRRPGHLKLKPSKKLADMHRKIERICEEVIAKEGLSGQDDQGPFDRV